MSYFGMISHTLEKFNVAVLYMIKHLLSKPTVKAYEHVKKEKVMPHINVPEAGWMCEADILHLPTDDGFKYLLLVEDVHNSLCGAQALKTMNMSEICRAFDEVFDSKYLLMPKCLQVDNQFNVEPIKEWAERNHVNLKFTEPNFHRQQAHINNLCKIIGRWLYQLQVDRELKTGKENTEWHHDYKNLIKILNEHRLKSMHLNDNYDIKKKYQNKDTDIKFNKNNRDILMPGTKIHLAVRRAEHVDTFGKKLIGHRATDISFEQHRTFKVVAPVFIPGSPPLYRIKDENGHVLNCMFTREQMQPI